MIILLRVRADWRGSAPYLCLIIRYCNPLVPDFLCSGVGSTIFVCRGYIVLYWKEVEEGEMDSDELVPLFVSVWIDALKSRTQELADRQSTLCGLGKKGGGGGGGVLSIFYVSLAWIHYLAGNSNKSIYIHTLMMC